MAQIIVKNGLEKDLSKAMSKGTVGEPIFTTDTEKFFVTNGSKVVEIGATDPDVMEHIKTLQDIKVDKVPGKVLSTNDYTTAEKNKLAGISSGANNYTHPAEHPASMIKFTDGKTFQQKLDDGSLRGPQGATGQQGPKGDTGAKGPQGATGPQGPAGTAGAKGNTGTSMRFKGAWSSTTAYVCDANYVDIVTSGGNTYRCKANNTNQAVTNTTYWELIAQKGATGSQGPQGIQGPKGDTGAKGATGPQGIQGPKGDTGAKGATGPQGPQGTAGAKGATGTSMRFKGAWSSSTAYVCDANYVDIVTSGGNTYRCKSSHTNQPVSSTTYWELIAQKGATGDKGATGSQGPQGVQGPKGDTGAKGATGANGFTWRPSVDSAGNLTWTNNGSTSAPTQVNIKGPKGDKGDTGTKGATGPQGPQGVQGPSGPNTLTTSTTTSGFTNGHFIYNNNGKVAAKALPTASTSAAGIVQLSSATNSTSTTLAATASAVKAAYDLAAGKANASHTHPYLPLTGGTITASNLSISGGAGRVLMIGCGEDDVYMVNTKASKYLQLKDNGVLAYSNHAIYHEGRKPTPAEIGAVPRNGTAEIVGKLYVYSNAVGSDFADVNLELREKNQVAAAQSGHEYAPALGFHWSNKSAANIALHSDGSFHFRGQGYTGSQYRSIYVSDVVCDGVSLKQSVSSGKNAIASAITAKGVAASGSDSHATLANKIGQIASMKMTGSAYSSHGRGGFSIVGFNNDTYNVALWGSISFNYIAFAMNHSTAGGGSTGWRVSCTTPIYVSAANTGATVHPGQTIEISFHGASYPAPVIINPAGGDVTFTHVQGAGSAFGAVVCWPIVK